MDFFEKDKIQEYWSYFYPNLLNPYLMSIKDVLEMSSRGWKPTRTLTLTPGCRTVVILCLCGFTPRVLSMCFLKPGTGFCGLG